MQSHPDSARLVTPGVTYEGRDLIADAHGQGVLPWGEEHRSGSRNRSTHEQHIAVLTCRGRDRRLVGYFFKFDEAGKIARVEVVYGPRSAPEGHKAR
jgi:hypothetical protein